MEGWCFMIVGDLVKYYNPARNNLSPTVVGIVLEVIDLSRRCPYRVRWLDHSDSERDWYMKEELAKL